MERHNYQGLYISLEGIETCGKTTQMRNISEYVKRKGLELVMTREPGGSSIGQQTRAILLNPDNKEMVHRAEVLFYIADRAQHIDEIVVPHIKHGKVVLADRGYDSTRAYQHYARGLERVKIDWLIAYATNNMDTDLTIVYDIDMVEMERRFLGQKDREFGQKKDRIEQEKKDFHEKVRAGFLDIARLEPHRVKVVNAMQSPEKVFLDTIPYLDQAISEKYGI